ncbi:MAG: histidine phosphatase family protein [Parvularculaceae bacterium]
MKELLLLRHAKSDWTDEGFADPDRPLNARGREAAVAVGARLAADGLLPDRILCSSAIRTRQTLALLWPYAPARAPTEISPALYLASPEAMIAFVAAEGGAAARVLVIAHNPGLEELARSLADPVASNAADLHRMTAKYPTAALARFSLDIDRWEDAARMAGRARLLSFRRPDDA